MANSIPVVESLSTDQIAAFVQLAQSGSIRAAAEALVLSEQGVRSRLLALEARLGVELYRKARGVRRSHPLTAQGRELLPRAIAFLQHGNELCESFRQESRRREVHVLASQYLIAFALLDAVKQFHARQPEIRVWLSAKTESEIAAALCESPQFDFGVAAPYETSTELDYQHWFSMPWSFVAPPKHPLLKQSRLKLADLVDEHLIFYERGSTGREHVIEAFQTAGLSPRVDLEATNTDLVVRLVEAGLGVAIVPLHPSGAVTRGRKVGSVSLGNQVRPIHSGLMIRKGEKLTHEAAAFREFILKSTATRADNI